MKNTVRTMMVLAVLLTAAPTFAQEMNLGGVWYHNGQMTFISNIGAAGVMIRTEDGRQIPFRFINNNTLLAYDQSLVGTVTNFGSTITWSNGTVWNRQGNPPVPPTPGVTGTWFHHMAPVSIRQNLYGYVLRNEQGNETALSLQGNTLVGGGLVGVLDSNGQLIRWSNGTVWSRTPLLGSTN